MPRAGEWCWEKIARFFNEVWAKKPPSRRARRDAKQALRLYEAIERFREAAPLVITKAQELDLQWECIFTTYKSPAISNRSLSTPKSKEPLSKIV